HWWGDRAKRVGDIGGYPGEQARVQMVVLEKDLLLAKVEREGLACGDSFAQSGWLINRYRFRRASVSSITFDVESILSNNTVANDHTIVQEFTQISCVY